MSRTRTIVLIDLVGYSTISDHLEQSSDVDAVARLNQQIQDFVDAGLTAARLPRAQAVIKTTGDGAILAMPSAEIAHRFSATVQETTREHNTKRTVPIAKRPQNQGPKPGSVCTFTAHCPPQHAAHKPASQAHRHALAL